MELTLTQANFKSEVLESKVPVLVDFWASWCGPCRMMGSVISEIAEEKQGVLTVGKVNVDEEDQLASEYGISSIPCFILFKDGKPVKQAVGGMPKENLLETLGV